MARRKNKLRKLKDRASLALRTGDLQKALQTYQELERLRADDPVWPKRQAEVFQRLEQPGHQLRALVRAADLYVDGGFVIQAIALCKQILAIEPAHSATLDRLERLCSAPGVSADERLAKRAADSRDDRGEERERVSTATHAIRLPDSPLHEVMLTEVVPGARPAHFDDNVLDGVSEIPVQASTPEPDSIEPAAHSSPDAVSARDQLARTPLFGLLDAASLRRLIALVELVELDEGDVLFRQGDRADCLYVIAEGAVVPIVEGDPRRKLAVLETGEFFGEIGLVTNQPRNATIEAIVDTRLLAIHRTVMWDLIGREPEVFTVLLRFLRDRLIDRLVRTSTFFAAFSRAERTDVARQFRFLEAQDGSLLIEQDRPADCVFVLLAGQMDVVTSDLEGDKMLATLHPGEFFGAMSLSAPEPARAAVVASGKCWLLALPHRRFQKILAGNPNAVEIVSRVAERRALALGRDGDWGGESGLI